MGFGRLAHLVPDEILHKMTLSNLWATLGNLQEVKANPHQQIILFCVLVECPLNATAPSLRINTSNLGQTNNFEGPH